MCVSLPIRTFLVEQARRGRQYSLLQQLTTESRGGQAELPGAVLVPLQRNEELVSEYKSAVHFVRADII